MFKREMTTDVINQKKYKPYNKHNEYNVYLCKLLIYLVRNIIKHKH